MIGFLHNQDPVQLIIPLVQSDRRTLLDLIQIRLVAHQCPDILDLVPRRASVYHLLIPWKPENIRSRGEKYRWQTHLIIVGLSSDIPHPSTRTPFGRPIGSSISGLKTPDFVARQRVCISPIAPHKLQLTFAISIHLFRPSCHAKTSILG
jgi:hypothetical protein